MRGETVPGSCSRRASFRWLRWLGLAVALVQLAGLIAYSVHIFHRFDLTTDFAIEHQAWSEIAHGHLSPYLTLNPHNYPHYGYPFWQDHLELITWPLALLWFVNHSSLTLLVAQDFALAGCTLIAVLFVADLLEAEPPSTASRESPRSKRIWLSALALGAVLVLVINPWVYWTVSFDFHVQPLATLFVLLAARELWKGRWLRSLWWIGALLLCGNVAVTFVIGLGIFALLSKRDLRLPGVGIISLGVVSSIVIGGLGGAEGTLVGGNYGYLAHASPGQTPGTGAILVGALTHPQTPLHMVWRRIHVVYPQLASSGMIGVATPLGFGMSLVVLLENSLNAAPGLNMPTSAFQSLPVYFLVAVGTVSALLWIGRAGLHQGLRWLGPAIAVALLIQAVVMAALWIPRAPKAFLNVSSATAGELALSESRVSATEEVIASQGVIGRFANRRLIYPFLDIGDAGQVVPVYGHSVAVVLTDAGIEFGTPRGTATAVRYLRSIHARQIVAKDGVYVFRWDPPRDTKQMAFPPAGG